LTLAHRRAHTTGQCDEIDTNSPTACDALDLAEHFFSPVEIAGLRNCRDEAALVTEFIELRTLKEAFLKGTGLGLSLGLNTMTFDLSVRGSVAFRPPVTFDAAERHFALFEPTPPTRLAVAARAPSGGLDSSPSRSTGTARPHSVRSG
jgi:hypothetical protein